MEVFFFRVKDLRIIFGFRIFFKFLIFRSKVVVKKDRI